MERSLHVLVEVGIHVDLRSLVTLATVVLLLIWGRSTHLNECLLIGFLKLGDASSLVVLLVLV